MFDASSLKLVGRYPDPYPCSAAFSADGSQIAIGSWEDGIVLGVDEIEQVG